MIRFKEKHRHTCPRRMQEMGSWKREEGLDVWETGHGLVGHQEKKEKSCSFCGSLHPDAFMEWIEQGAEVGPTDKSYKAYITYPGKDPEEGKVQEYTIPNESGGPPTEVTEVYGTECKFYFQHLSDDQQIKFVELYNNLTMRIGYPGRFYVLPFFMTTRPES